MSSSILDYLSTGDMHYYLQYDGNLPYQTMEEMHSRFISELGFQSYPDMQTIRAFASPEDMKDGCGMDSRFDSGDHLHINPEGGKLIAQKSMNYIRR